MNFASMLDEAISHGSTSIKLKTGSGDFAWDKRCIQLAVARNIRLGLDVNGGWTPAQAAQILPKLGELNIAFVEQPVGRDIEEWRELRTRMGEARISPLVADESLQEQEDFAEAAGPGRWRECKASQGRWPRRRTRLDFAGSRAWHAGDGRRDGRDWNCAHCRRAIGAPG